MHAQRNIIYSSPAIRIVTEPYLVGDQLLELAIQSSVQFLTFVAQDLLLPIDKPDCVTFLNILNGGKYYGLDIAWNRAFGTATKMDDQVPAVTSLRAKRFLDEEGNWKVRVWDHKGQIDHNKCKLLVIGYCRLFFSIIHAIKCA